MRTIEELSTAAHLCIVGRYEEQRVADAEMYHGFLEWPDFRATVIWGYNEAGLMEHVSVSSFKRKQIPSWEIMCRVKDMFFRPDEMVVQIHPTEDRYLHGVSSPGRKPLENVLHLWRPKDGDFAILNHPELWD